MSCQVKYMTLTLIFSSFAILCYFIALVSTHWIQNDVDTERLERLGISKVYWRTIMVNETMIGLGPRNSTETRLPLVGVSADEFLMPTSFHIAQACYYARSISLGLLVICLYMHSWKADNELDVEPSTITNLRAIYACCIISALLGMASLISFTICSGYDEWTPYSEHNYFGWAFYVASLSVASMWLASIATLADVLWQKKANYNSKQDLANNEYEMVDMKKSKEENEPLYIDV
ncbi:uncharacterized protein LOC135947933 [Cloeon dipterum]|uniref:uncharacterized protein LOC135947933 n=1 Tax=Cloeon dipterum TaxID=197152 RepID=UPI00321F63B8